jgi:hypothetical protein
MAATEHYKYYSCLRCGSLTVPVFHWAEDWLFEFHKMFMREKEIQVLETSETEVYCFEAVAQYVLPDREATSGRKAQGRE